MRKKVVIGIPASVVDDKVRRTRKRQAVAPVRLCAYPGCALPVASSRTDFCSRSHAHRGKKASPDAVARSVAVKRANAATRAAIPDLMTPRTSAPFSIASD